MQENEKENAKAIIYGLAVLQKNRTAVESYRKKNHPALRKKAEELHRQLNFPLELCGLEQIELFENKLDVEICVMSSDNFNQISLFLLLYVVLFYIIYCCFVYNFSLNIVVLFFISYILVKHVFL